MSKHEKKTFSLLHYPVLVVFSLFFIGLFTLDMVTPDRSYSELENTTLSQRPALTQFTAKGLNSYFTAYTKYVKDQVAGRATCTAIRSSRSAKRRAPASSPKRSARQASPAVRSPEPAYWPKSKDAATCGGPSCCGPTSTPCPSANRAARRGVPRTTE